MSAYDNTEAVRMDLAQRQAFNRMIAGAQLLQSLDGPSDTQRRAIMAAPGTKPPVLGLSRRELEQYSASQAILDLKDDRRHCFSREITDELTRAGASPNPANGNQALIPNDWLAYMARKDFERRWLAQRDLTVASASGGGYLVATDTNVGFIELARNRMVVGSLGATMWPDLVGNVTPAKATGAATAYFLSNEAVQVTESQQTFAQVALTPKTVGAYTEFSRLLQLQAGPNGEAKVFDDLMNVVGLAGDLGALTGSGAAGQPTGLAATAGVGTASGTNFNATAAFTCQTNAGNALSGSFGFATTQASASAFAQRVRTGFQVPLWEGNVLDGVMCGARAMSSQQVPANTLYAGPWDRLILATWGALAVEVNPFANFPVGTVGARVLFSFDCAYTLPSAFTSVSSIT